MNPKIEFVDLSQQKPVNEEAAILIEIENRNIRTAIDLTKKANLPTEAEERIENEMDSKFGKGTLDFETFEMQEKKKFDTELATSAIENSPEYKSTEEIKQTYEDNDALMGDILKTIDKAQGNLKGQKTLRKVDLLPNLFSSVWGMIKSPMYKLRIRKLEKQYAKLNTPKEPLSKFLHGEQGSQMKGHVASGAADALAIYSIYSIPTTLGGSIFGLIPAGMLKVVSAMRNLSASNLDGSNIQQLNYLKGHVQEARDANQTELNRILDAQQKMRTRIREKLEANVLNN